MNKTFNINLGGHIFHIDDVAYSKLEAYINRLKAQFLKTEGGNEIIQDIESRLAELFKERISNAKEVVTVADVDEVIAIMGQPEDYLEADEEAKEQNQKSTSYSSTTYTGEFRQRKRIFRDPDDKLIGGVASGVAAYFNIDSVWIRLLFVLALISGFGFLFYIILWIVIPEAKTTAEKLQMRGESVNVSNIEKSIREELDGLNTRVKDFSKKARNYNYRQHTTGFQGFLDDLISFLKNLFVFIFKALGKIIGFFFILIAFIVIIALTFGLFTGSIQLAQNDYSLYQVFDFLQLLAVNNTHYYTFMIGVLLTLFVPLFLIIYFGVRILFKTPRLNPVARNCMWIGAVLGVLMLIASLINFGIRVDDHGTYTSITQLDYLQDDVVLALPEDSLSKEFLNGAIPWIPLKNDNAIQSVNLRIKQSTNGKNYLETKVHAQGLNSRDAATTARKISYNPTLDSNRLLFPTYLLLGEDTKFRFQQVDVTLYLKEGQTIYLAQDIMDVAYDIPNQNNYWDHDMTGHTWKMEKDGLICTDCPDEPETTIETNELKIDDDTESVKVQIDSDGIKVEVKEKLKSEPTIESNEDEEEQEEDEETDLDLVSYIPRNIPSFRGVITRNFVVQL